MRELLKEEVDAFSFHEECGQNAVAMRRKNKEKEKEKVRGRHGKHFLELGRDLFP